MHNIQPPLHLAQRFHSGRTQLRALLAANYISWFGNGVTLAAVPIYVLTRTGSSVAAGTAGAANALPLIISGLAGGVLVDRWGCRRSSILADLFAGLFTAAVPVLGHLSSVPLLAIVGLLFLRSLFNTPGDVARIALLPLLADQAGVERQTANTLFKLAPRLALIAGPAAAGVCISLVGPATTLALDAGSFAASALLVGVLVHAAGSASCGKSREPFARELRTGLQFVRTSPGLIVLLGIILAMNFIDEAFTPVLLPVYCRDILRNPTLIGWLLGADGFGAVLGTLLYLLCGHRLLGLRWATFISCLGLLTTTRLALASLPGLVGASCLLFALGLASGPVNPIINTVVQGITSEALRGRVFGAISSVAYAAAPLGIMAAGWLVALRGLQVALDAFGAFYVVVFLVAWYSTALKNLTRR